MVRGIDPITYYFISFTWVTSNGDTFYENNAINIHPMDWLYTNRNNSERFRLIFWEQISRKQFNAFHGRE